MDASVGSSGWSVVVAAHGDVVGVDEGGGVAVAVPDRPARPEVQVAGLGAAAAGVDPHRGALLEDIAAELNGRPRQTLGFKTPSQALAEALR